MDTLQRRQQLIMSEPRNYAKHAITKYNKGLLTLFALFVLVADSYPLSNFIGRQVQAWMLFLSMN